MKINRSALAALRCTLAVCVGSVPAACDSPAAPTVRAAPPALSAVGAPVVEVSPGPPDAVLAVESFTLVRDAGLDLAPVIRVAESSGRSAAGVVSIEFDLADSTAWGRPLAWGAGGQVPAGGVAVIEPGLIHGEHDWTFSVPAGYTGRVSVSITFADERGRRGTVTAVATLPQ